jgi:hypothetical protein
MKVHLWIRLIVILSVIDAANATKRGSSWCMLVVCFVVNFTVTYPSHFSAIKARTYCLCCIAFTCSASRFPFHSLIMPLSRGSRSVRNAAYNIQSQPAANLFVAVLIFVPMRIYENRCGVEKICLPELQYVFTGSGYRPCVTTRHNRSVVTRHDTPVE